MTPAAVGLFVLAEPVVRMLFEHGSFGPQSTWLTARALSFYAPGLMVFCLAKVFVPAFYALQDTRTPVRSGSARFRSTSRSTWPPRCSCRNTGNTPDWRSRP